MGTEQWARGVLTAAFAAEGIPSPSLTLLQTVQAQSRGEGYYGKASRPEGWAETKNWGAIQTNANPCVAPNKNFPDKDEKGNKLFPCFKGYATDLDAARDQIRYIKGAIPEIEKGDSVKSAAAIKRYYHYAATTAEYALMLHNNAKKIAAELDEPLKVSAPISEGEKVDTDAIKSYIREVKVDWEKTAHAIEDAYGQVVAGKRAPLPFDRTDFDRDYQEFTAWAEQQLSAWVWLSDDVYDAARRWHLKQKAWYGELGKAPGQTSPSSDVPSTTSQQEKDKEGSSWTDKLGSAAVIAAAAGGAYLLFQSTKR